MERMEQPEAHAFTESGPLDDVAEAQHLARGLERLEQRGGMHQRLDEIAVRSWRGHGSEQDTLA